MLVKCYPKNKQSINRQQKFKPHKFPNSKRNNCLEFDKGYYCQNCEYIINKRKHQIDKKVRRQDHYFLTRLPYADKNIRENWMNKVNTTYISTQDLINNLRLLKDKTKLKFYKNISKFYDEMKYRNFRYEEDPFSKIAQSISKIYLEVLLFLNFLQTKPQVK